MLRNYAKAGDPVATDAMLVSDKPRGGLIVSKTVNNEVHDMIPVNHKQEEAGSAALATPALDSGAEE